MTPFDIIFITIAAMMLLGIAYLIRRNPPASPTTNHALQDVFWRLLRQSTHRYAHLDYFPPPRDARWQISKNLEFTIAALYDPLNIYNSWITFDGTTFHILGYPVEFLPESGNTIALYDPPSDWRAFEEIVI